jgi:hypothetical protein
MTTDDSRVPAPTDRSIDDPLLRRESVDHDGFIDALIDRLSSVPGLQMAVKSHKGRVRRAIGDIPFVNDMHRSSDPIRSLRVSVGSSEYWVEPTTGSPWCGVDTVTVTRGRTTEIYELATWTDLLIEDVIRHKHLDPESAAALRSLIHGERV